eukprot:3745474-Amphidinium_carterae.1
MQLQGSVPCYDIYTPRDAYDVPMPEACGGRMSIPYSGAAQLGATQQVNPEALHRPAHLDVDMGLYLPSGAGVYAEAAAQPPMFMGQ